MHLRFQYAIMILILSSTPSEMHFFHFFWFFSFLQTRHFDCFFQAKRSPSYFHHYLLTHISTSCFYFIRFFSMFFFFTFHHYFLHIFVSIMLMILFLLSSFFFFSYLFALYVFLVFVTFSYLSSPTFFSFFPSYCSWGYISLFYCILFFQNIILCLHWLFSRQTSCYFLFSTPP